MFFWFSASAAFFSSKDLREVESKYTRKRSNNAVFSLVAAVIKSPWFNVISEPGIGTVVYFPRTYPSISFANARAYSNTHERPIELILEYVGFAYGTSIAVVITLPLISAYGCLVSSSLTYWNHNVW